MDVKCVAAALCFLTSNILFIVHGVAMMREYKHHSDEQATGSTELVYDENGAAVTPVRFSFDAWKELDPAYIQNRWLVRDQNRAIMMTAALFGAMAWFWLMVPIIQAAWVLSRGGKRKVGTHMMLAALAVCGGIIELLARLLTVGMDNAQMWLARDFNMNEWDTDPYTNGDGTGWRVLEMIHIVTRGMILWVDAFEALALFGIVVILFHSVATEPKFRVRRSASIVVEGEGQEGTDVASGEVASEDGAAASSPPPQSAFAATTSRVTLKPTFSRCFTYFGLFVGLLSLVAFVADVLRFLDWKLFGRIAMSMDAALGVVFLPIWLLYLGCQLPEATGRYEREERRAAMLLSGREDDETAALKGDGEIL